MSNTKAEIQRIVDDVLDSVDYVCDKFDISEEAKERFLDEFLHDSLIPSVKDAVLQCLRRAFWGEEYKVTPRRITDYTRLPRTISSKKKEGFDFFEKLDNLVFPNEEQIYEFVEKINDWLANYGRISVGSLFELIGESAGSYETEYYGWTEKTFKWHFDIPGSGYNQAYVRLVLSEPERIE